MRWCAEIFVCLFLNNYIHYNSKLFGDLLKPLFGRWKMLFFFQFFVFSSFYFTSSSPSSSFDSLFSFFFCFSCLSLLHSFNSHSLHFDFHDEFLCLVFQCAFATENRNSYDFHTVNFPREIQTYFMFDVK